MQSTPDTYKARLVVEIDVSSELCTTEVQRNGREEIVLTPQGRDLLERMLPSFTLVNSFIHQPIPAPSRPLHRGPTPSGYDTPRENPNLDFDTPGGIKGRVVPTEDLRGL